MGKKPINIETIICSEANFLQVRGDAIITKIIDAELDILECEFMNDSTVTINTKKLTYINLTIQNLLDLIDLIDESDEMYETLYNK